MLLRSLDGVQAWEQRDESAIATVEEDKEEGKKLSILSVAIDQTNMRKHNTHVIDGLQLALHLARRAST